jgi:hypothetical protein
MKIMKKPVTLSGIVLINLMILLSCAGTQQKLIVSHYSFDFDNQTYRIRSVISEKEQECFNELIAKNFLAVDFNQDRIIDRITMGEVKLAEAQHIYEYGLEQLSKEHKLREQVTQISQYIQEQPCCLYEIKSFRIKNGNPFNQFILTENRNTGSLQTTVGVDQNADGTLDILVKGSSSLEDLQPKYQSMIKKGLEVNQMVKFNGMVLVKQE